MKVHRFSIDQLPSGDQLVIADPYLLHQVRDVLELRVGEQIQVFDQQTERRASILSLVKDQLVISLGEPVSPPPPLSHALHLAVSLLKGDAWDDMVREVSQLGVKSIQPLVCQRTIVRELSKHKRVRYELIAREATELSGGLHKPVVLTPMDFSDWVTQADPTQVFVLDQSGQALSGSVLPQQLTLGVGPEGGWTSEELKVVNSHEIKLVSLLPRVLTARFAPAACAAAILCNDSSQPKKKLL